MRLHDLRPADGSRTPRTRVGRGIAAGKGKTAGRGTKGQKARAGGSIPPWFEGGQTPLHQRIPKLRGFKNRFKLEYEIVNVGAIAAAVESGAFELPSDGKTSKSTAAAQITINQDLLRAVGLVRTLDKPLKVLGAGDLSAPLFVVADAFTASARSKIEAAGGSVNVLEMPTTSRPAIGVGERAKPESATIDSETGAEAAAEPVEVAPEGGGDATPDKPARKSRARAVAASDDVPAEEAPTDESSEAETSSGDDA